MDPIIFNEEQLSNLDAVGNALFQDINDPRSISYVRKLNRPQIRWHRVVAYLIVPVLIIVAWGYFSAENNFPTLFVVLPILLFLFLYFLITLKRAIICTIKIYQRYAPDSVRNKCRFEPSCSEYMILAIRKYGLVSGVKKGVNRLKRCNKSDGGFDFP